MPPRHQAGRACRHRLCAIVAMACTPTCFACVGAHTPGQLRSQLWAGTDVDYDRLTSPGLAVAVSRGTPDAPSPDTVTAHLKVFALEELDGSKGTFTLDAVFYIRWSDPRLQYPARSEGGCLPDSGVEYSPAQLLQIWHPDPYLVNSLKTNDITDDSIQKVRIYPAGEVKWSIKTQIKLGCKMELKQMPFDTQRCTIRIGVWRGDEGNTRLVFPHDQPPVSLDNKGIGGNVEWILRQLGGKVYNESAGEPTLDFHILFERKDSYWVMYVMLPVALLVAISYSTFYLQRTALPARVGSSVIGFLTITNFQTSVLKSLPKEDPPEGVLLLSYLRTSLYFCAFTIFEVAFANYLMYMQLKLNEQRRDGATARPQSACSRVEIRRCPHEANDEDANDASELGEVTVRVAKKPVASASGYQFVYWPCCCLLNKAGRLRVVDVELDVYARIFFPIAYAIACFYLYLRFIPSW